jgi:RNA polymerase subunit RPABC4/transcription elongation factor Spt4
MEEYAILAGVIGAVWALLLWLSIIVWIYRDIRERTRDLGLQVLAVFVGIMFFPGFNIPGLALYLMLRPRETLEESYARSLEEEALLREIGDEGMCPSCRRFVEQTWRICPFCATQLKDVCVKCEQLLSFNWVACPYCATERRGIYEPPPAPPPEPVAAPSSSTHTESAFATETEKAEMAVEEANSGGTGEGSESKSAAG